jgi:DDE superfamily endonuclease
LSHEHDDKAMRILTKPSTAHCTLNLYTLYLLAEPLQVSCVRLAQILMNLSHDSINRFLLRERYSPRDLFNEVKGTLKLSGGTLSGDDTVLDKPYRNLKTTALVDYFWSGKHKRVVKGLNLITLYYTDPTGISVPVNYRVNDKQDGKTKHDYFREMIAEVIEWGLKPAMITADSWYASVGTLTHLKNGAWGFLFAIEANRLVQVGPSPYQSVQSLEIPPDGLIVDLKHVGLVKVFRTTFKQECRHYVMWLPAAVSGTENRVGIEPETEVTIRLRLEPITAATFQSVHDAHWGIEQFHRAVKQVCNIERFQVRDTHAIHTHIFSALRAFVHLEFKRVKGEIRNWYEVQRTLFNPLIRSFIQDNLAEIAGV